MARYKVQGPDGAIHVFEGPDNATPADIEAFAAKTFSGVDPLAAKKAAQLEADRKLYAPTQGMSTGDKLAAGFGKAIVDTGRGLGQMVGLVDRSDVDAAKARDKALMDTAAGATGNFAGNVALTLPTAAIPGAASLRGAALIGGAQGLIQQVGSDDSRLQNVGLGAGAGAAGVAAGRALAGLYQGGKALLEPFSQTGRDKIAGRVIQRFADNPNVINSATSAPSATGARLTLAEQTGDAGLARLQDSLRSVDPQIENQIGQRLRDNNAARVDTLRSLAGDSSTRAAAETARKDATSDLYRQATNATYTVTPELENLLNRPAVQQAMARAKTLAQNQGRGVSFDVEAPNAFSSMGVPTQTSRQINGQALQDLKMAMDEMLSDPASGFTGKAGNTVKDLRGKLLSFMEDANPAFKEARTKYAAASKPLNGMDVGEEILRRATSNTSDLAGNPRMQANALLGALRDEPALVNRAIGKKGVNSLADVFTPEQLAKLQAVAGETDRAAAVASAGAGPGSATAQRMASQNILARLIGPTGLPQSWAESAIANTAVGKPLNLIYGGVAEPKIQQALAEAVLDPAKARQMLQAAQQQGMTLPDNIMTRLLATAARNSPATLAVSGER
jgi:hypothetical protein